jgi:hypothetical protein
MTNNTPLVHRLRDRQRIRAMHGLTGWVLHEEALRDEAAARLVKLEMDLALLLDTLEQIDTARSWGGGQLGRSIGVIIKKARAQLNQEETKP